MSPSRWENLLWPRWLPEAARMPVLAQITGAVALTALLMGPWWSRVDTTPAASPVPAPSPAPPSSTPPAPSASSSSSPASPAPPAPAASARLAHLNLDVHHTFAAVNLVVTVDGKRVLDTKLEGSGKKFKMFGKRQERSYTRTLDLQPGVRLVRVNVKAPDERFDQTRVERFDLEPASVASLRITADKSAGLVASADRPPVIAKPAAPESSTPPAPQATVTAAVAATDPSPASPPPANAAHVQSAAVQQADALSRLLNSLRSILIAIAGFVATTSAGFVLEQFLGAKKRAFVDARRSSRDVAPSS